MASAEGVFCRLSPGLSPPYELRNRTGSALNSGRSGQQAPTGYLLSPLTGHFEV